MKRPGEILQSLLQSFDGDSVLLKIKDYLKVAGTQLVYGVLLLFFAHKRSDTPTWAKRMVLGSLAYVLAPIDLIPDLSPFLGFTDDLGVLMFGLVSIAGYINEEVKVNAKTQLNKWFGKVDPNDLTALEEKIGISYPERQNENQ
ncbi:MAG: DUF1232 domain-containing protein [Saprospiraceae bacterium]|nr:DUF1232 domain-containing protein [Saprospiraceae bacterium]